jgi:hypothetical protein
MLFSANFGGYLILLSANSGGYLMLLSTNLQLPDAVECQFLQLGGH